MGFNHGKNGVLDDLLLKTVSSSAEKLGDLVHRVSQGHQMVMAVFKGIQPELFF